MKIYSKVKSIISLNSFAVVLVFVGLIIMSIFYFKMSQHYLIAPALETPSMDVTGQVGDFVGGVVGTLFSLVGILLLFITLRDQRDSFKKERFENHFFELIKLHRENIGELEYSKFYMGEMHSSVNRKVFKEIFKEFEECLFDVGHFLNSLNPDDYYISSYRIEVESIFKKNNLQLDLIGLATINIAYCIVFFGIDKSGEIILKNLFKKKYKSEYILHVLNFIKLKPKMENVEAYKNWEILRMKKYADFKDSTIKLYFYNKPGHDISLSEEESKIYSNFNISEYYSGHQHRLGHYFRHLYQSFRFLNSQDSLSVAEKYNYGKTFRAQLSTYEQSLLFFNSISSLGMKWELTPEVMDAENKSEDLIKKEMEENKLITKYNLIKNLPGLHFYKIHYKVFYPKVKFDSED